MQNLLYTNQLHLWQSRITSKAAQRLDGLCPLLQSLSTLILISSKFGWASRPVIGSGVKSSPALIHRERYLSPFRDLQKILFPLLSSQEEKSGCEEYLHFFLLACSCSSQPSRTQSTCSLSIRSWRGSSDRKDATALGFSQQDILTSIRVLWSNEAIVLIPFIASLNFKLCQFTAPSTNLDQPRVRQICRVFIDNDSRPEHKPTPSSCVSMATQIPWNCPYLSSFNWGHFEWSASKAEALPWHAGMHPEPTPVKEEGQRKNPPTPLY